MIGSVFLGSRPEELDHVSVRVGERELVAPRLGGDGAGRETPCLQLRMVALASSTEKLTWTPAPLGAESFSYSTWSKRAEGPTLAWAARSDWRTSSRPSAAS